MWASEAEATDRFHETTLATYDFRVYDVWDNGEFLTGAKVDLIERGVVIETRTFGGSTEFEDSYREGSAAVQAASYANAWVEAMTVPLEERLGLEWEREMEERFSYGGVMG